MKQSIKTLLFVLFFILLSKRAYPCTVSTTDLNFTNYDTMSPTPLNTIGSVTVDCSDERRRRTRNVRISIGPSANSGGFIPRGMKHASLPDILSYNLYIDSAGTRVWGDGSAGTQRVRLRRVRRNRPVTRTIYGIIPPLQNVSLGAYSDILTVTITW